jgi:hypothetical protein
MLKKICLLTASSLLFASSLAAQSAPSATSRAMSIHVGGGISTFNPDWGCVNASVFTCWDRHLTGITAIADANHVVLSRLGVEAEARWLHWGGPGNGLVQSNYLVGPRYRLLRVDRFSAYGKGLLGESWMTIPGGYGSRRYFTFSLGPTAEYKVSKRLSVRADYEYEIWPQFAGISTLPNHKLTPNGFTFGATYKIY